MRGERGRRKLLGLYVLLVVVGGALALALHLPPWPEAWLTVWEFLAFLGLAVILDLMVVPLAGGGAASTSFAIYFGGLLALGTGPTIWAAAMASLWSEGLLKRRSLVKIAFNAGHSILSLLAAGLIYSWAGGTIGSLKPERMPAVALAAATLWVLETAWVAFAVALERGGAAWRRLLSALKPMLVLDAALASVGLLLALLYQGSGRLLAQQEQGHGTLFFLVAIATIPSGLLYYAYRLQGHLHQTYAQSLQTLGSLVEAKLQHLQPSHGEQVATLAAALAQALELPAAQVEQVRYAGYLHDIGKVGVPARFLNRSRDSFEGESAQVRLHPELGLQILTPVQFLRPAAEMVRAHHERWDGLGYPGRLQGASIPVGARILALADAYCGLTNGYGQAPVTPDQAMLRLRESAGSRFDPRLVEALTRLLRAQGHLSAEVASYLAYVGASLR